MDASPVICHCSVMARDTHHTVTAGILEALERGFLIATAGVMAGLEGKEGHSDFIPFPG
jgi:hypothetical protein